MRSKPARVMTFDPSGGSATAVAGPLIRSEMAPTDATKFDLSIRKFEWIADADTGFADQSEILPRKTISRRVLGWVRFRQPTEQVESPQEG